jgi:hypothetical protein
VAVGTEAEDDDDDDEDGDEDGDDQPIAKVLPKAPPAVRKSVVPQGFAVPTS